MFSSSFDEHITVPTRVTENTATLIDHIWSHNIDKIVSGVFEIGISDRHIIFAFLPFRILAKTVNHKFKDHSDHCIVELEKSLIDNISLSNHLINDGKSMETVITNFHCLPKNKKNIYEK